MRSRDPSMTSSVSPSFLFSVTLAQQRVGATLAFLPFPFLSPLCRTNRSEHSVFTSLLQESLFCASLSPGSSFASPLHLSKCPEQMLSPLRNPLSKSNCDPLVVIDLPLPLRDEATPMEFISPVSASTVRGVALACAAGRLRLP